MSNRAWMPLHIGDYLKDTGHLTAAEHGAYLLLIMHYWQHGKLPDDERLIARIAKLSPSEWADSRDILSMLFSEGWTHKRIDQELAKADEIIEKRRNAANERHSKSKPDASAVHVHSISSDTGALPRTYNQETSSLRSDVSAPTAAPQRAKRLSADWSLPVEWRQEALDAGLRPERIDLEADKLRDWSRSSKNGAKLDWRAAWRNWCREAASRAQPRGSPAKPDTVNAALQRLTESMRSADVRPDPHNRSDQQAPLRLPASASRGW